MRPFAFVVVGYLLGLIVSSFICSSKIPKFKPGQRVQYGPIRVNVKNIGWSDFHGQWSYFISGDDWTGYVLAKDLKKCRST